MNVKLLSSLLSLAVLTIVVVLGLTLVPAFAGGCAEGCADERADCYQDAEDWWGQCYQVCDQIWPDPPYGMDNGECKDECDIQKANDEDVCETSYRQCVLGCQV